MERPEALRPGVYGLVGGPVNAYLLDDRESGLTIIDAGLPGWARRILRLIASIDRKPEDLRRILITHADVDHAGALRPLAAATGAEVLASARAAQYIREGVSPPHIGFPMSLPVAALNFLFRRGVEVSRSLADGDRLELMGGLRVVSTPGHTPDHLCFFLERDRALFAGDLLRNVSGLELFPRNAWDREAMAQSLRRVAALEPESIYPGHGRPWRMAEDPGRLEALIEA